MRGTSGQGRGSAPGAWPPESFLGRLQPQERDALLAFGGHDGYRPGEHLLIDGDRGGFVILIHAGQVKVVMQDEQGNEHLLGIRARGSLLGELSYIDGRPRSASVVAIGKVWASSIAWETLDRYLRDYPRVSMEIARVLADRLRASDQSSREIRSDSVAVRVAKLLLSLADDFDDSFDHTGRRGAVIQLSQADVAQLAHAAEVTVNRVLRGFRKQQVVRTDYRKLAVPCLVCLDRLATAVAADPKEGVKGVLGCGGADAHTSE
jgi:CRP/FNR family transcriptional regulator, cyclic AMP receptor protein